MEKSKIMEDLFDRLGKLEDWRAEKAKPEKAKKKNVEDEDVCPQCGDDLVYVEQGITYCEKCKNYYEEETNEG